MLQKNSVGTFPRYPIEHQFGSEFPAICNHCGVMMAWSCKTWKFCKHFLWKNDPFRIPQNSVLKVFTASPIDVVVFKCYKIYPTINWRNRALFTWQKTIFSAACQTVATARIAPKICQGQPATVCSQCSRFHPYLFTFSRVANSRTRQHCFLSWLSVSIIRPKQHCWCVFVTTLGMISELCSLHWLQVMQCIVYCYIRTVNALMLFIKIWNIKWDVPNAASLPMPA